MNSGRMISQFRSKWFRIIFFFISTSICVGIIILITVKRSFQGQPLTQDKLKEKLEKYSLHKDLISFVEMNQFYINFMKKAKVELIQKGSQLKKDFDENKLLKSIGDQYLASKLLDLALNTYQIGIKLFPEDAYFYYQSGVVLSNLILIKKNSKEYFYKSREYLLKAISVDPQYIDSYYSLAVLYLALYKNNLLIVKSPLKESLKMVDRYISISGKKAIKGYFLKAMIFYEQNNIEKAINNYLIVLTLTDPKDYYYEKAKYNIKALKQ